ncbi:MAG: YheU family protein [bacterium]
MCNLADPPRPRVFASARPVPKPLREGKWLDRIVPARDADHRMDAEEREPIEIPASALSPDALRGLVEEFVSRDGTDYGRVERSLDEKVGDVLRQLSRGDARIFFDPDSRSTHIVVSETRRAPNGQ